MALLVLIGRKGQRGVLAPAPFVAAYWGFAIAAPTILFSSSLIRNGALVYIACMVTAFFAAALLATAHRPTGEDRGVASLSGRNLTIWVKAGAAAGLLAGVVALYRHGFNPTSLLSLESLLSTGNAISERRYGGGGAAGIVPPLLLTLVYAAALLAPFARLRQSEPWWILILPTLSVLPYSTITTERLAFLLTAALTAGGWVAAYVLRTGAPPQTTMRRAFVATMLSAAAAATFIIIAFVRTGRTDSAIRRTILEKMEVYAFGYLPAFSQWFEENVNSLDAPTGWGTSSLPGVEFLSGIARDSTRAYDERTLVDEAGNTTNVYSAWRSVLYDFGIVGGALLMICLGWMVGRLYRRVQVCGSMSAGIVLGFFYAFVLLSQTLAVTTFTNVCVGLVVALYAAGGARVDVSAVARARPSRDAGPHGAVQALGGDAT